VPLGGTNEIHRRNERTFAQLSWRSQVRTEGDEIAVTVQGKIASGDPQRGTGNLSHIQMRFRKRGRAWELVEPPSYLAS
jgi:hypothetical protein